jgi:hypothetical protein
LALLAAAYDRPVDVCVLAKLRRACERNSRLRSAACKLEAESNKFGMAGSPGML